MTFKRFFFFWIPTVILAIASLPLLAFADTCYEATGFGGSAGGYLPGSTYNGTWTEDTGVGTCNGLPVYSNGNGVYLKAHNATPTRLNLGEVPCTGVNDVAMYNDTVTGYDPTTGTWLTNPSAFTPGTFSLTSCGGPGPTPTTTWSSYGVWGTIATTTQEMIVNTGMPFWEIALGVLMAFFLLFLILVGLSKSIKRLLR